MQTSLDDPPVRSARARAAGRIARAFLCIALGALASLHATAFVPETGLWGIDAELDGKPGRGFQVDVQGTTFVLTFYGYAPDGTSRWYYASGTLENNAYGGKLQQFAGGTAFGAPTVSAREIASPGNMAILFTDSRHGVISLPGEAPKRVSRQLFPSAPSGLVPASGLWAIDAEVDGKPGRGFQVDAQGGTMVLTYYGYGTDGTPRWNYAAGAVSAGAFSGRLESFEGGTAFGAPHVDARAAASPGNVTLVLSDSTHGTIQLPGEGAKRVSRLVFAAPLPAETAAFRGSIALGAPTGNSVRANVYSPDQSGTVWLTWGTKPGVHDGQGPDAALAAGTPVELAMTGLAGNTRHYYRLHYRDAAGSVSSTDEYAFQTARAAGSRFTFTVQADSHLDENSSPALYRRTLENVLADAPDFHVDLGDTFMTEKHALPLTPTVQVPPDAFTVDARYAYERGYFAPVSRAAPLFLVNGNHDGEAGWLADGTAQNLPVWATQARHRFFPAPVPDGFYGGDAVDEPFVGKRASWYSWTWGDALFIVLDPFWNTKTKGGTDGWAHTLGERQYAWLRDTLAGSRATWKFVFVHNLVGGLDGQMRGGIEAAPFYEWGGRNADGSSGFALKRKGWEMPIHDLLVKHGVTAVYHGHDHLFAKQDLDGIVYQELAQPSAANTSSGPTLAADYHYGSGVIASSSGHLRVSVGPEGISAQYVRAWLPASESAQRRNGQVEYAWQIGSATSSPAGKAFAGSVVLGSPTGSSVRASVHSPDQSGTVALSWGSSPRFYTGRSADFALQAGSAVEIPVTGLAAGTRHYYRLEYREPGAAGTSTTAEASFRTAPAAGQAFTFTVQGDSHPERERSQFDGTLYARTLLTAAADSPDFHIAIGDDFSVDTLDPATVTSARVRERYAIQRPYLGLIGRSAPVFLVNGNHEQAARCLLDGTPNNVAVWAQTARNSLYAQPAPDGFYSGNPELVPFIGLLRNWYAWTWGDALFVVIDPYWSSTVCVDEPFGGGPKRTNMWDVTHGEAQYRWLKATLEQSTAKYKFVFAHHVMGTGRGGVELAGLWEWGGKGANGVSAFATERPGWPAPIHQLLAANRVTVFFQGHDHIWARQSLDGVTYQTLPEPADPNYALYNADAYVSGDKLPNTGYARVTVSPAGVKVDYVRTWLPADEGAGRTSGAIAFSYTVP